MNGLVFAIKHSFLHVRRHLDERLADYGVSTPQLEVLLLLSEVDEVEQRALQDAVANRSASLTTLLGRMEEQGLISRRPDPGDGRRVRVSITEDGTRLLGQLTAEVEPPFLDDLQRGIAPQDLETTRRVLNQIAANMIQGQPIGEPTGK